MSSSHSVQKIWSPTPVLGLVVVVLALAATTLVVANPVSDSVAASTSVAQQERNSVYEKPTIQRYRWAFQQPSDELLNSLRERILLVRPMPRYPFTRKRSCFINAGLNNNCDFKDFMAATSARRIWQSPNSPGKRSAASAVMAASGFPSSDFLNSYYSSSSNTEPEYVPAYAQQQQQNSEAQPSASRANLILDYLASLEQQQQQLNKHSDMNVQSQAQVAPVKRMQCISGLPGGDCENSFLGGESLGQDFLRPGGRNPGRR